MRTKLTGFTLIELMVVIAILAIVVGIALPAYNDQVEKARRSDAIELAMGLAQRMERCFTIDGAYTGGTCPATGVVSEKGYYSAAIVAAATTFTVTVTPVAGKSQVNDTDCASFTIDQAGQKTATSTSCW